MRREIHNLRRGTSWRYALLLVPITAVSLSLAGVVLPADVDSRDLQAECDSLRERAHDTERERAGLDSFHHDSGFARLETVERGLQGLLPRPISTVSLHGVARCLAELAGFELRTVDIKDHLDADFPRFDDRILRCEVRLEGQATLGAVLQLLSLCRTAGLPLSVDELHLDRNKVEDPAFDASLSLSIYSRVPAAAPAATDAFARESTP